MRKIGRTNIINISDINYINEIREITSFCETALKYRTATNFFGSPEVLYNYADCGNLYISESQSAIFMFADAGGFFRLYYILMDISADITKDMTKELCGNAKPVVIETAYRGDNPPISAEFFIKHGFNHALTRSRMTLKITDNAVVSILNVSEYIKSVDTDNTHNIDNIDNINAILDLFRNSFDRYTGCIPAKSELQKAADERRIITVLHDSPNGILCGALLYENTGAVSILNNIAVAPDMRGRGYGEYLLSSWISRCGADNKTVMRLWVADKNTAAVKLYEKHGFKPDGLKSVVLIYK